MSARPWLAALVGLALAAFLVLQTGPSAVGRAVLAAGWDSVLAAFALHVLAQLICAVSWWVLSLSGPGRPTYARLAAARLLRDAMSQVLPVVPVGEVAAVRELMRAGLSALEATALTIADVTVELASQVGFSLLTLALVTAAGFEAWRLIGLSGLAGSVATFAGCVWIQHSGGHRLARLCGRVMPFLHAVPHVWERLGAGLRRIYVRRGRVALAVVIHLAAWFVGGLQAWAVLRIMGTPVTPAAALALEAFVASVCSIAPTPGALGVQEGSYVLAGATLGIDGSAALALSLVKRARDLLVALPVIIVWQAIQVHRARHEHEHARS